MNNDKMVQIYERIRKKSKSELELIVFLLLIDLALVFLPLRDIYLMQTTNKNLSYENALDIKEKGWYTFDNNILLGSFASDIYGAYYVTFTGDNKFIGIYVDNSNTDKADRIMEECWAYLDGETDNQPSEYLSGRGYVMYMSAPQIRYFESWFEGADKETMEQLSYKVLYMLSPLQMIWRRHKRLIQGSLLCTAMLIAFVFQCIFGSSAFKRTMRKHHINFDMLIADMADAEEPYTGMSFGQKYSLFYMNKVELIIHDRLVWIYQYASSTGAPANSTLLSTQYHVVFIDRDNKERKITVPSAEEANGIIGHILDRTPFIYNGYSDQLANMRKKDFAHMVVEVDVKKGLSS